MNLVAQRNALTPNLKDWEVSKALFPAYSKEQLKELVDYIKLQKSVMGLPPVVIAKDGRIVDGYNRVAAYRQMGLETVSVLVYEYKDEREMEAHAIDLNAKRRHLDAMTLSKIVLRLAELRKPSKEEIAKKNAENGKKGGKGNKARGTTVPLALNKESVLRKVCKEKGVSPQTVRQVKMVLETEDKNLIAAVEDKKISIAKGAELAKVNVSSRSGLLFAAIEAAKHPRTYACKIGKKSGISKSSKSSRREHTITSANEAVMAAVDFHEFSLNFISDSASFFSIASEADLRAIYAAFHNLSGSIEKALSDLRETFPCLKAKDKGAA